MTFDVEADLRFDAPFGSGHLSTLDGALVIGVDRVWTAVRGWWWFRTRRLGSVRAGARRLASLTGRDVVVQPGRGPRIRLARAPDV